MKSPIRSLLLAGVMVAAAPLVTFAQPPDGGAEHHRGGKGHRGRHQLSEVASRHAQELGISADTITRMKAAEEAARPELEKLHAAVREARAKVAGGGDRAQLETAHQALRARREALRTQVSGLLTDQQRTKLKELAFRHRGGGRGGPRPGGPPPAQTQ